MTEVLTATGPLEIADLAIDVLSRGQRQRAWIEMVLAQHNSILPLDELTTSLDVAYQLDLVRQLHRESGVSVVMVMHHLTMAAR